MEILNSDKPLTVQERLNALEIQQSADAALMACLLVTHQDPALVRRVWAVMQVSTVSQIAEMVENRPDFVDLLKRRMAHWTGLLDETELPQDHC